MQQESTDEKGEDLRKFFENEEENLPKDTDEDDMEEDSAEIEDLNVDEYIRYIDFQNLSFFKILLRNIVLSGKGQKDCVLYTDIGYQAFVVDDSPPIITTDFLSK